MQAEIKKLPKSKMEMKVEVPAEELSRFVERAAQDLGKEVELPGFRKGKAPRQAVEEAVGQERIFSEAVQNCVQEKYLEQIKENQLEPLGQPQVEILKMAPGNPLEFKAVFPVMPEVKLPDYREIASKIKRKKVEVSDRELEEALKWLQKSRAKFSLKSSPAEKGDWVEVEYREGGHSSPAKDAFVLGEGRLSPGFEDKLAGMEAGQEKEVQLSQGKYSVKMNSVQKMELPELNDEFAKSLGQFENLSALRQSVSSGLMMEKERAESQRVRQEILDKIAQKSEMEIPDVLIEEQKRKYLENLKKEVQEKLKTGFEEYLKRIKKTEEELLNSFQDYSQKQVKNSLVMRKIQKKENIAVSEEDVSRETQNFPIREKEKFDPEQLKSYTKEVIRQEKTFQLLEKLCH